MIIRGDVLVPKHRLDPLALNPKSGLFTNLSKFIRYSED